jgi:hypothetical protein
LFWPFLFHSSYSSSPSVRTNMQGGVYHVGALLRSNTRRWPFRIVPFCQAAIFVLAVVLALPLIRENSAYLTTALTEVTSGREHGGDFIAFYAAGQLYSVRRDASAYDLDAMREAEFDIDPRLRDDPEWVGGGVNPFRNPPYFLLVLRYLASFSLPVAFVLTAIASGALLGAILAISAQFVTRAALPVAAIAWVALCLAYYDVWHGLTYGQLPAYIAALFFLVGVLSLRGGNPLWAGIAFAMLWLKVQYVPVLLLFLIVTTQWRALIGFSVGTAALLVASIIFVGFEGLRLYGETLVELAVAPRGFFAANYESMINWRGLLERALAPEHVEFILPLQVGLTILTIAVAIWAWRLKAAPGSWRSDLVLASLPLALVLTSPHVHVQDMLLLLPAFALVIGYLWRADRNPLVLLASVVGLYVIFWLLPRQTYFSPRIHLSAVMVFLMFASVVGILRRDSIVRMLPRIHPQGRANATSERLNSG